MCLDLRQRSSLKILGAVFLLNLVRLEIFFLLIQRLSIAIQQAAILGTSQSNPCFFYFCYRCSLFHWLILFFHVYLHFSMLCFSIALYSVLILLTPQFSRITNERVAPTEEIHVILRSFICSFETINHNLE